MSPPAVSPPLPDWLLIVRRARHRVALWATCVLWLGLAPAMAADQSTLKVGGTGTTLGTMRLLAAAFEKANPNVHVTVLSSLGSTGGIKATTSGAIDIGVSARPLSEAETGLGAKAIEYGSAPLAFAVSKATEATEITTAQLLEIYAGRVTWPNGMPIRVVMRPESDANTIVVSALSPEMKAAMAAAEKRPGMLFALTDQEAIEYIERVPGALGATSLNEVMAHASVLKALKLNGVAAVPTALADRSYPLRHTYFLITTREPSPLASSFVDFVLSEPGRKILSETGHAVPDSRAAR